MGESFSKFLLTWCKGKSIYSAARLHKIQVQTLRDHIKELENEQSIGFAKCG